MFGAKISETPLCNRSGRRLAGRVPFKDRFKGPFKGRNRAASAEQLEVMQSYNSQETPNFFCEKPKVKKSMAQII